MLKQTNKCIQTQIDGLTIKQKTREKNKQTTDQQTCKCQKIQLMKNKNNFIQNQQTHKFNRKIQRN